MELPIDHFRLLGVSPTTDGQTVLRMLQQRLDRAPDQGFTHDTLQARAELLRSSAELLSDEDRRQHYERELTSIADSDDSRMAGLEIPSSREVGGLLLLMEAGQAQEAFDAASRGLQPPQAPALGSSREADLTLLAGLACQAAAADYRNQRRFETAARTLQQGLQLLQRMGQQAEQRRRLEHDLQALQPYRVLDLISRDLSAVAERQEGIGLLDQLVQRRGGLEGDADPAFAAADFRAFFSQIRPFLTVQEQVDLFSRWAEAGCAEAERLTSQALCASGFVQRKPERIQAALERLQNAEPGAGGLAGDCLQLLLGRVDQTSAGKSDPADSADDALAQLCVTCRDWLSGNVLPGFRDIEAEADLEAWFADRDVQAYIEQQDRIRGRQLAAAPSFSETTWPALIDQAVSPAADDQHSADRAADTHDTGTDAIDDDPAPELPLLAIWRGWRQQPPTWLAPLGLAVAVAVLGGVAWLTLRPAGQRSQPIPVQPSRGTPAEPPAEPSRVPPQQPPLPLRAAEPDEAQLQTLLEAWLQAKAAVLAGGTAAQPLESLARGAMIRRLEQQRSEDRASGATERISTTVQSLSIRERSPGRIEAAVSLRYSDQRLDASGRVVASTPSRTLNNLYVFGRDGETWHVAAFRPGS